MDKRGTPPKRALGRGLGALIVNTEIYPANEAPPRLDAETKGIQLLAIDAIQPNPQQPRTVFSDNALEELATSIRTHGIIQPLIVTADPAQIDHYWLVAGERRWRAARLAELREVPVLIREASPQQALELALVENIQRADLNALEEAAAYQALMHEFKLTHSEIAERVGKNRSTVTNTLRLLDLPVAVQEALTTNRISAGHARALLALPNHEAMQTALQAIANQDLNVRQTEALIRQLLISKAPPKVDEPSPTPAEIHITYLENRFRTALGTRVQLNRTANGSGRLVVHFYNDDDLEQLYQLIAGGDEVA